MATNQQFLLYDNTNYANFSNWASAISANFASFGWAQSTDTGQVMWSGMSITAVAVSGTTMTCTYSSQTGLNLAIGRALTVTGWTGGNTGNNGVFVITGGSLGVGSGTFTAINASAVVVASGGTGVVTIASSVPGSGAYFYEIWTPNDGLTNFFTKMEYGNFSGTNAPNVRITLSTTTNGAGTATGLATTALLMHNLPLTVTGNTQWECDFSGAAGRIGAIMWRNGNTNNPGFFAIERSVNSSGAYIGTYATLVVGGYPGSNSNQPSFQQQSLVFSIGASIVSGRANVGVSSPMLAVRVTNWPGVGTTAFNNSMCFDTVSPVVGYFDYGMTQAGVGNGNDIVEGVTFQVTLYGATRTYMPTKNGWLGACIQTNTQSTGAICLRYD